MTQTFFSKNKKSATKHLKELCNKEHSKLYCGKKVKLAKKQIEHSSKWKTWEIVK